MARSKTNQVPQVIRAVLYTRISVDRENQSSIANQLREIRESCATLGMEIVGEFSDVGKSAFKLDVERPGFDAAMRMIETGQANQLVVWKLDRMTRNARGFATINDRLESCGATFRSIKEPWFDTSSPIGYALVGLMAALAEMEAGNIQGRILSWHEGRRINGDVPIGPTPYGYIRPSRDDDGWRKGGALIVNDAQAVVVGEMAQRVLAGDGLRDIARDLTARGIPSPSGKAWNHTSIRKIILSPTVAAMFADGRTGESWDAIVERDQWRQLHAMLTNDERLAGFDCASRVPTHLLTNLMTCGKCDTGALMNSYSSSTKGRKYKCKGCGSVIVAHVAESAVVEWVAVNVTDERWRAMRAAGKGRDASLIAELEQRIEELTIDYYSRKGKRNEMRAEVYATINDDLMAQLDAAENEPMMELPEVDSLRESWGGLSIADQRLAIVAAIESIKVAPLPAGVKATPASARARVSIEGR
jgi:DNA invertase Pin-like site-specific DNA recombinase